MSDLQVKAAIAGLFFGMWPLFMNKSRLSGNVSSAIFSIGVFLMVLPFALRGIEKSSLRADWMMVALAAFCGGMGLLFFNGMLCKAAPQNVSSLFMVMILVQTAVPALCQIYVTRSITATKGFGFVAAAVAALLLVRN